MKTETIKTYKHKTSGWLATLTTTNCEYLIYRTDGSYAGSIAAILIENSNDWDLVIEDDFIVLDRWCSNNKTYYLKINGTKNKYRCIGSNITKPYYFIDTIEYTITDNDLMGDRYLIQKEKQNNNIGYQILTVVDPNPKRGIINVTDGTFNYTSGDVINSIRRLSDNEIFTVGDAVQSIKDNWKGDDCKIEIIHVKDDGSIDFTINENGTKGIYRNCLDNFRKVKQNKDGFEILKFYDGYNEYYKKQNGSFTINLAYEYTLDSLLLKPDLKIFSIRRLSDGRIFTVGDIINHTHDKIKRFDFIGKGWVNEGDIFVETFGLKRFFLGEITIPTKKPLFVTEDGVEIMIGDDYWVYDYGDLKDTEHQVHKVNRASQTHTGNGVNRKYFSTKEKAEEYLRYNKICFSLNDVLSTLRICITREDFEIAIEEIFKSRINI